MEEPKSPEPQIRIVSRSRGKHVGESTINARMREKRKAKGLARSSDESESDSDTESQPGVKVLHQLHARKVLLCLDGTVVKKGNRIALGEAEALKVAENGGIPAPQLIKTDSNADSRSLRMTYIQGQSLDTLWPIMTDEQKKDMAQQLQQILRKMRTIPPPTDLIGACDGSEIRSTRVQFTYHLPPCRDEEAFNEFLTATLAQYVPPLVKEALVRRLRTDHRIVLSHCDLAPRNIMVQDGKIQGLVDWEDSGWYPEYWEYVKFFQRPVDGDWKSYAEDIFPKLYHDELVDFIAMSRYQNP